MRRETAARVLASIFVLTLVLGVLALGTGGGSNQATPATPTVATIARAVDEQACDAEVDDMVGRLGAGFDAAADLDAAGDDVAISDERWEQFFTTVVATCPDSGVAVSELVMFTSGRASTAEPGAALIPLLTAQQLCSIDGLDLTAEATSACADTSAEVDAQLSAAFETAVTEP